MSEVYIKQCEYCGKTFETNRPLKRFCNKSCKNKSKQKRLKQGIRLDNIEYTKTCKECGKTFVTIYADKEYCSKECKKLAFNRTCLKYVHKLKAEGRWVNPIEKYAYKYTHICATCGKTFKNNNPSSKYCQECSDNKKYTNICKYCGETISGSGTVCDKCKEYLSGSKIVPIYYHTCKICGKEFVSKHKNAVYCSKRCERVNDNLKAKKYRDNPDSNYKVTQKKSRKKNRNKPYNKIRAFMRSCFNRLLYNKNGKTSSSILGYAHKDLKEHLEQQFTPDMTWENYGTLWHIDHIRPVASYKFFDDKGEILLDVVRECNKLENLRPILAKDNIAKGSMYNGVVYKMGEPVKVKEEK